MSTKRGRRGKIQTYEVYIVRHEGVPMYVGEGKEGRYLHVNSGTSNVYEANRMHFQGIELDVEVITVQDKEASVELERELIKELRPAWNVNGTEFEENRRLLRKVFSDIRTPRTTYLYRVLEYYHPNLTWDNKLTISTKDFNFPRGYNPVSLVAQYSRSANHYKSNKYITRCERVGTGTYDIYLNNDLFESYRICMEMIEKA